MDSTWRWKQSLILTCKSTSTIQVCKSTNQAVVQNPYIPKAIGQNTNHWEISGNMLRWQYITKQKQSTSIRQLWGFWDETVGNTDYNWWCRDVFYHELMKVLDKLLYTDHWWSLKLSLLSTSSMQKFIGGKHKSIKRLVRLTSGTTYNFNELSYSPNMRPRSHSQCSHTEDPQSTVWFVW